MAGAAAERLGFSSERLGRATKALQEKIDRGDVPGVVVIVSRRGEPVIFEALGFRDPVTRTEMTRDSIFRIAGISKALVSLGAMVLVEDNMLHLASPISEYLPALKNMKVGVEKSGGELELVPAHREPTILDLLRQTSGFVYGIGTSAVRKVYRAANLDAAANGVEYIARMATVPLHFQPGTQWAYGSSIDVLGHIIEAITGDSLETFMRSRVAGPLGMPDTGFWVPNEADHHRIAQSHIDSATGKRILSGDKTKLPTRFIGGGAMVSTAPDLARFCQMFLNNGALDGVRFISRKTVELMTADQLPPHVEPDAHMVEWLGLGAPVAANGMGVGLGFTVATSVGRLPWHGSAGEYKSEGLGSFFWVDPREQLYVVVTAQSTVAQMAQMEILMRSLVYGALID